MRCWLPWLAVLPLIAAELLLRAFTTYSNYDDQGYIMLTLQHYREGHPLFDRVFSQYGPAYYILRDWLYGPMRVSHDLSALFSAVHALLCSLALGALVWLRTHRWELALVAGLIAPSRVMSFFGESGHPQETICLLVLLAALALVSPLPAVARGAAAGVCAAAVAMMKVNVGVFLLVPIALYYALAVPRCRLRDAAVALLGVGILLAPFVLMRRHIHELWAASLAVTLSAALAPILYLGARTEDSQPRRGAIAFVSACSLTVLGIVFHQLARGTTPVGLLEGLVLMPLRFASIYVNGFTVGAPSLVVTAAAMAFFFFALSGKIPPTAVGVACLVLGAIICARMFLPGDRFIATYFTPFFWLVPFADRLHTRKHAIDPATALLFVAGIFLVLQVYPVAGNQVSCGTILYPLIGLSALHAADRLLRDQGATIFLRHACGALILFVGVCLAARLGMIALAARRYAGFSAVDLPGMRHYRLPEPELRRLRRLTAHAQSFDTFVTMPGYNSLYFLAERPAPSTFNATTWMTLLDHPTQEQVVARLAEFASVGGIRDRAHASAWVGQQDIIDLPLVRYFSRMRVVEEWEGIEFLAAPERAQ